MALLILLPFYFLVFVPFWLPVRLLRDPLRRRWNPAAPDYWDYWDHQADRDRRGPDGERR
ncbi:hypothetical protein GCM10009639_35370 [Kitasatospora putterlickiae]|uniref:Uncharacterized protein n=1 Tax=Kitasatospora putterlickiae TaxID=221725 RepID=A0ABN1Y4K6_9ACTN